MKMYVVNFKNEGDILPEDTEYGSKFEFCIHNNIIGVSSQVTDDTLRVLREIKKGDYFWIHEGGEYYIAYATDTITTAGENYNKYDVGYYIKCRYYPVGCELPADISFCKDLLETSEMIREVEYQKVLFDFTQKLVTKSNRKMFIPNLKKNLVRNKKKIIVVAACLFLVVVAFFTIKGVQYMQVKAYISSLSEELNGKTYIYCDITEYSESYKVIEFNQEGKDFRTMTSNNRYINDGIDYINSSITDWEKIDFKVDFMSGDIYFDTHYKFLYQKGDDTITVGSKEYVLVTDTNYKVISDMCYSLLYCQNSDDYNAVDSTNKEIIDAIIERISSYNFIDTESMKSDIYFNKALASLGNQSMYGFSVLSLINECTKNLAYDRYEYNGSNIYTYVYSCEYAPNKADLPNYYVNGELLIHYNFKSGEAAISGSVANGLQTYAILKAFS